MNPVTVELILYSSLVSVLMASLVGILWAWGWALWRIWTGRGLLENVRTSALGEAPWGALTVFAVVLLYVLVNFSVTRGYAAATGRHPPKAKQAIEKRGEAGKLERERLEKDDGKKPLEAIVTSAVKPDGGLVTGNPAGGADQSAEQTETELLIQLALINVLLLILVPALVRLTSRAGLADLGLDFRNWTGQMAVGGVAALLMTPAVLAIQSLAVRIWPPHRHPVEDMILDEFTAGVAILAVFSTMILAPMIEELLFRGIVQRWLTRLFREQQDAPASLTDLEPFHQITDAWSDEDPYQPPGKAGLHLAKTSAKTQSPGSSTTAILMTSFLFSAMHLPQWPAPIGIFLLSMALGALYQKTGSLISAVTMHGAFNGFSTMGLLMMALHRQLQPEQVGIAQAFFAHLTSFLEVTIGLPG